MSCGQTRLETKSVTNWTEQRALITVILLQGGRNTRSAFLTPINYSIISTTAFGFLDRCKSKASGIAAVRVLATQTESSDYERITHYYLIFVLCTRVPQKNLIVILFIYIICYVRVYLLVLASFFFFRWPLHPHWRTSTIHVLASKKKTIPAVYWREVLHLQQSSARPFFFSKTATVLVQGDFNHFNAYIF